MGSWKLILAVALFFWSVCIFPAVDDEASEFYGSLAWTWNFSGDIGISSACFPDMSFVIAVVSLSVIFCIIEDGLNSGSRCENRRFMLESTPIYLY